MRQQLYAGGRVEFGDQQLLLGRKGQGHLWQARGQQVHALVPTQVQGQCLLIRPGIINH